VNGIDRRRFTAGLFGGAALPAFAADEAPADSAGRNILRIAFEAAETGFDPARISDLYSSRVTSHIFEGLYRYDPLAVPVQVRPLTAAAMPEVSDDFRVWTVRLQPGIRFADDPAFGGKPRELVAQDYVYSYKRMYDPATLSPTLSSMIDEGLIGLEALRERALREKKPFDYAQEVEGLRALDRYTLQFKLREPRPRFLYTLCNSSIMGAVAREVIEAYPDPMAHPVGTGPYRLAYWRRSSRIVLERNPNFRVLRYDAEPAADDAQGQAWLARYKGRPLPFNDGVEISVIEEGQPRWLAFLNNEVDCGRVPPEFTNHAMPNGELAPNLAKRKVGARRYVNSDFTMSWFNMDDPVVGGYTPEKVALRRAIGLSYQIEHEIRNVRRGSAIPAQGPMPPGTFGYDPNLRTENGVCDPARANALLDLYGYRDRDGDGWRELPDGTPFTLRMASQASQIETMLNETWYKSMASIGVKLRFDIAQWPENMKSARAGRLQMWGLGSTAGSPDCQAAFEYMYGKSIGSGNLARFSLPAFDALYERMLVLPDGEERAELIRRANNLVVAYMPYKMHVHRVYIDMQHPWVSGYRQTRFRNEVWQYIEIDGALRARTLG